MEYNVIRALPKPQPEPPVEEIILRVSPSELLWLVRVGGNDSGVHGRTALYLETKHGLSIDSDKGYNSLRKAAVDAGLIKNF